MTQVVTLGTGPNRMELRERKMPRVKFKKEKLGGRVVKVLVLGNIRIF